MVNFALAKFRRKRRGMNEEAYLINATEVPGDVAEINLSDYHYDLPGEKIAQYPAADRDNSRLLVSKGGSITDTYFFNLPDYIPEGHMLVFNNSRVVRARILFRKSTGARIELLCIEPVSPSDYERSFGSSAPVIWRCMVGNFKKWKNENLVQKFSIRGKEYFLTAEKIKPSGDEYEIRFSWDSEKLTFSDILDNLGHTPLPPYITRTDNHSDLNRYQTVYSRIKGSVAAPTAGLHFTDNILHRLTEKGITRSELTLHVGAGTFQPVKTEKISQHEMHGEHIMINKSTLYKCIENEGKIIAVGTTTVRTLESLYWLGTKMMERNYSDTDDLFIDQWEPYLSNKTYSAGEAYGAICDYMERCGKEAILAVTRLMIVPGYDFRVITGMLTNFHQPGSTLLLLIAAWCGERWKEIYEYAISNEYRFLSYGDSSLIFR